MKLILAHDVRNNKMKILELGMKEVVKAPSAYKRINRKPSVHENNIKKRNESY
ncbi:hypothetical protein U8V97_17505 [Priestia filamentosa]|uniref:hypothetical protein n=1 Tax=Priestia filamentosa TaxID=1402861 RepID=UPI00397CF3D2